MSDKNGRKIPLPASRDRHPPRSALRAHKPALKPRQRSSGAPPGFILPAQPVLATKPPVGPGWLFAVKHDGFRIVARKEGDKAWKGDDGCRRGDKAPYVPHETCARCLLVLRALGGVWSAVWLAGVYFFQSETPALFGGFFGCVAGSFVAQHLLGSAA